jgi:PAT family beta-lactamase induction signal transducer AmpG
VGVLGGLYLVQGIVWGFAGLLLLPRLAAAGVSLEHQAGILALAGLPWVFKLAWGPVLDAPRLRRVGAGRTAAFATVIVAASLVAISTLDPPAANVRALAIAWLVLNVALSLQDVATDALALDVVPASSRGLAVSVMLGGQHLGAEALAGAWVGAIVATRGLAAGLWVLAAIALLVAVVVGATTPGPPVARTVGLREAALRLARAPRGAWMLAFAGLVFAADVLTSAVSGQWFVALGWSPEDAVERVVTILLVGNIVGYACAAAVVDRLGHANVLRSSSAALGVLWIAFAATQQWWTDVAYVQAFVAAQTFITAWLYVATHAVLMDATEPEVRATQFAVLTACLNLPRVWAPPLAAWSVGALGFAGTFAACGAWQIAIAAASGVLLHRECSSRNGTSATLR